MDTKLNFKLEIFEGPLDLLLNLIDKNKINIYDIPIVFIFGQYMEYIEQMKQMDMEIAGEFVDMAAELILIKSKLLLPKSEKDDDPRSILAATLIEYKLIKEASQYFGEQYNIYSGRITKEPAVIGHDISLYPQDIELLRQAFIRIYKRMEHKKNESEPVENITNVINRKITPIQEKILNIMRYMYKIESCNFVTLLEQSKSRSDLIAIFAAVLELLRSHRLIILHDDDNNPLFSLNKERKYKNEQN